MTPNEPKSGRGSGAVRSLMVGTIAAIALSGGAAQAQELTHRFINPSFGGNPFNSEHLLGIANIHRPDEPEEPGEPVPTEEDLLAQAIRTRLLTQLQTSIRDRLDNAQPGESGEFVVGNQRISFTRTNTELRVTFLNITTGESSNVVVPVVNALAAALSAEQTLLGPPSF